MNPLPDPEPLYAGWMRTLPCGPWHECCRAYSEEECWKALLEILPEDRSNTERLVLQVCAGHPERRRKPR